MPFLRSGGRVQTAQALALFPAGDTQLQTAVAIDIPDAGHAGSTGVVPEYAGIQGGESVVVGTAPEQFLSAIAIKVGHHRLAIGGPDTGEQTAGRGYGMDQVTRGAAGGHVIDRIQTDDIL